MSPIFLLRFSAHALQKAKGKKGKKGKSFAIPLFRAIPRDDKSHVMLYNVEF
jgi:hypothetical protein